jgi:predicted Zn-dependent peptidase
MFKNYAFLGLILFSSLIISCNSEGEKEIKSQYKYTYSTVENDPMNTLIYTLDNGLKVYMSVNENEPRIYTNIAVRTGSKQDPSDATGLAHYLEHMMFKGTSKLGTNDWEEEKVMLKQISDLYESHRNTSDAVERKQLYHLIDSVSGVAAGLAIANEYDKMISSLGAKGTNAYTSVEQTVYLNDIPSNELEKWLYVESERFGELVLRLFHTELEAVYEEFNRGQASDFRIAYQKLYEGLFKKHAYGTQSTIGTSEHLKSPSMEKIHAYFNEKYVPNNMAIILAGDLDPDATIDLITQYFGSAASKEIKPYTYEKETPFSSPEITEVVGTDAEFVMIGYRVDGDDTREADLLTITDMLLTNGQAGLVDLNLAQQQKVLDPWTYPDIMDDYSVLIMSGAPRANQSLEEVTALLTEQVTKIANGEFDDWLIEAVIKNMKLQDIEAIENNSARVGMITESYVKGTAWNRVVERNDRLSGYTKEDVMKFAKETLADHYFAVYKKQGASTAVAVEKPEITPISINRDAKSDFYVSFDSLKTDRIKPQFINFKTSIAEAELSNGLPYSYVKNATNELFNLVYIFDMGSDNDKDLALAIEYLPYLGTDKYSAEELQKEFYKLGLSFEVNTGRDQIYVTLSGLDESLKSGIKLFEHILTSVKSDGEAYDKLVDGILKERMNSMLSKNQIFFGGMLNYATYGENSPMKNILTKEELSKMNTEVLASKIHELNSFKHRVYYYGPSDQGSVKSLVEEVHQVNTPFTDYPEALAFTELDMDKDKVFYMHYDMPQVEMMMVSKGQGFNADIMAEANIFNQYFGAGLSSIIFQEIRESKALAYSAYSYFTTPLKQEDSHYVRAYVGSQVDKLPLATEAMLELMNDMPKAESNFDAAKDAALKKIETRRVKDRNVFWTYQSALRRGLDYDINEKMYAEIQNLSLDELGAFFDANIKGNKYSYVVIGDRNKVDQSILKDLGEYRELSMEEIFGYDQESDMVPVSQ